MLVRQGKNKVKTDKDEDENQAVSSNRPVPQIDPARCDGCVLCAIVCPNHVIGLENGLAVVVFAECCDYTGLCEKVCPKGAIWRLFEFVWPGESGGEKG